MCEIHICLSAIATIEGHRGDLSSETDEGETAKRTVGSSKRSDRSSGVKSSSKQKLKHGRRMNRLSPGTVHSILKQTTGFFFEKYFQATLPEVTLHFPCPPLTGWARWPTCWKTKRRSCCPASQAARRRPRLPPPLREAKRREEALTGLTCSPQGHLLPPQHHRTSQG